MSFLSNLAKKATDTASRVYDMANPVDGGLSYNTRKVAPAQAKKSVVQQINAAPVVNKVNNAATVVNHTIGGLENGFVVQPAKALGGSVYGLGRIGMADVTRNKIAAVNARSFTDHQEQQFLSPFIRPMAQAALTIHHPFQQYTAQTKGRNQKILLGDTPVQNIQAGVVSNYNAHQNLNPVARVGLATAYGGGQAAQDMLAFAGAKGTIKSSGAAVKDTAKMLDNATHTVGIKRPTNLNDAELNAANRVQSARSGGTVNSFELTDRDMALYHNAQRKLGAAPGSAEGSQAIDQALLAHNAYDNKLQVRDQQLLTMKDNIKQFNADHPIGLTVGGEGAGRFQQALKKGEVWGGLDGKRRFEMNDQHARLVSIGDAKGKLGNVLRHDVLYENYPQLKDRNVDIKIGKEFEGAEGGVTDPVTGDMQIYATNHARAKKELLHEVQHNLQKIEGRQMGTSPEEAGSYRHYYNNAAEAEARAVAERRNLSDGERYVPDENSVWHGTASGDLKGGLTGLHVGTKKAAQEALEAQIGIRADGKMWDGSKTYGNVKLAGKKTQAKMQGRGGTGFNAGLAYDAQGNRIPFPEEDFYLKDHPELLPKHGDGTPYGLDYKPTIAAHSIKGGMTNSPSSPLGDWQANGIMGGLLKRGKAKNGYYYKNEGEDAGSISAVVPNGSHLGDAKIRSTFNDTLYKDVPKDQQIVKGASDGVVKNGKNSGPMMSVEKPVDPAMQEVADAATQSAATGNLDEARMLADSLPEEHAAKVHAAIDRVQAEQEKAIFDSVTSDLSNNNPAEADAADQVMSGIANKLAKHFNAPKSLYKITGAKRTYKTEQGSLTVGGDAKSAIDRLVNTGDIASFYKNMDVLAAKFGGTFKEINDTIKSSAPDGADYERFTNEFNSLLTKRPSYSRRSSPAAQNSPVAPRPQEALASNPAARPIGQPPVTPPAEPVVKKQLPVVPPTPPVRKQLPQPQEPDMALSKFPNRLLEEDRTAPIHQTLVNQSTHEVLHNKDVLAKTGAAIAKNEDEALAFAKRGTSTEANATAMQLLHKYLAEGNAEKADDLVQAINPRFTRQGQETQILAEYSKLDPAGAVRYAARQVEKAVEKTAKGRKIADETQAVHKTITNATNDAASQLEKEINAGKVSIRSRHPEAGKLRPDGTMYTPDGQLLDKNGRVTTEKTPAEMLANRIKASSERKTNEPDPIKDMVNTLHKVAKEVLPESTKKTPRDPMQLVGQAIKDKAQYKDVWDKAQKIVAEKYADNPQALEELDKYFNSSLARPFSKGQLNRGVQQGLKGTDLGKLVKQHFTKVDETGAELKQKLIEQAGLSEGEATQLAGDIQKRYGELVQARKDSVLKQMFGDRPTPEQKGEVTKILELSNLGALSRDNLRPLVAKKLGLETLSTEATARINQMAQDLQKLPEGSPERLHAAAQMMQYIHRQVPDSFLTKAISTWKAGLLTGVKTITGNGLSNGTFAIGHDASKPLAVGIDKGISMFTHKRSQMMTYRGRLDGGGEGLQRGWQFFKTGIDERGSLGNKFIENAGHREVNFKNKALNTFVNGVFRNMAAQDRPFYYSQLRNSLYDLGMTEGHNMGLRGSELKAYAEAHMKEPSLEIMEKAKAEADKAVLANDTPLSKVAGAARNAIDNLDPGVGKGVAKVGLETTAPFTGVPSAFVSRVLDFTPIGAFKEAANQLLVHRQFDQRALSTALSEATTGTAVMWLGAELAKRNMLSGAYPTDPHEQARWKTQGIQPNSIKIYRGKDEHGKSKYTWISANYLGPAGMLLNAGGRANDSRQNVLTGPSVYAGMPKDLTQQSFLQGVNNAISAVNDPGRYLNNYVNSQAGSVVPTIANDIGNATDNYQRDANNALQAVQRRLPIGRQHLPQSVDVYGNALKQTSNPLDRMVNPLRPSNQTNSPLLNEVERLHLADKNNKDLQVTPTKVDKSISVEGTTVNLNDAQRRNYQIAVGQYTQQKWNEIIQTPAYKAMNDADKAATLEDARKKATALAQRQFVLDNNLGTYKKALPKSTASFATSDMSQFAKAAASGSSSSTDTVNPSISNFAKGAIKAQGSMSAADRTKLWNSKKDSEYNWMNAQYENKKANGEFTPAQEIAARTKLNKAKIGAKYDKNIRDLYGQSKANIYDYITSQPNSKDLASQMIAYDKDLYNAGIVKYSTFKNGLAPVARGGKSGTRTASRRSSGGRRTASSSSRRSSGGSGSTRSSALTGAEFSSIISGTASAAKKAASAKVAKVSLPTNKGKKPSIAQYKKGSSSKVAMTKKNLSLRRA